MSDRSNSKVRVGFVMHQMQVAGAEVLVKQIIERLASQIDPTLLCLDGIGELGHQLATSGVPVINLGRKPGLDWSVPKKLAFEVRNRKIELLHSHQYTPFFYSAIAKVCHRLKPRILFTEHGRAYPDTVSWKRRWANRFLLQHLASETTACCDFSTRALKQIEGFSRAFTLRNGIELTSFPPRGSHTTVNAARKKLGLKENGLYVVCVARLHPIKDHATLIRSWEQVVQAFPDATLLLIGDGPERNAIESQIVQAGLPKNIQLLGIRHDVSEILRAVDVATLTSVSEAASLTLLEAMACECPTVVTNVGGNNEHIRDGIDGFLVPRGNFDLLAARMIELLSNPRLRARFGVSARRRVACNFSLGNAIGQYAKLYQKLAKGTERFDHSAPTPVRTSL